MTIGRAHKWSILNGLQNEQCTFGHIRAGQRSRFAKSHLRPITARPVWSQQSINICSLRFDRFTARPKGQGVRAAQRRPCATLSRTLDQLGLLQLPRSDQLTWLSQTGFARLAKQTVMPFRREYKPYVAKEEQSFSTPQTNISRPPSHTRLPVAYCLQAWRQS